MLNVSRNTARHSRRLGGNTTSTPATVTAGPGPGTTTASTTASSVSPGPGPTTTTPTTTTTTTTTTTEPLILSDKLLTFVAAGEQLGAWMEVQHSLHSGHGLCAGFETGRTLQRLLLEPKKRVHEQDRQDKKNMDILHGFAEGMSMAFNTECMYDARTLLPSALKELHQVRDIKVLLSIVTQVASVVAQCADPFLPDYDNNTEQILQSLGEPQLQERLGAALDQKGTKLMLELGGIVLSAKSENWLSCGKQMGMLLGDILSTPVQIQV